MESLRYLLVAIAALTLLMSVVSGVNPNYFAGLNAFADNHDEEEEDDDNSGSNDDHEEDEEDDEENDEEDDEEDAESEDEEDEDDKEFEQSLGDHSKVSLEIDDDEVDLEVEIEDGDLDDGTYDVVFNCSSPDIDEEFENALEVDDGHGNFETEMALENGTYTGCKVDAGGLTTTFPTFIVAPEEDDDEDEDEEDEEEHEEEGEDEEDEEHESESKTKSKLKTEGDGVEIEVEVEGLNVTDGSYDAIFTCEEPELSMILDNAFEVEDGDGKFKEIIGLANGTYSGCEITVEGTEITSFDDFTVSEETEEEQEHEVEAKRKEKKERIVTTTSGEEIREKHRSQNAASPGEYEPGWNYMLEADGTTMQETEGEDLLQEENTTLTVNMSVWKSNKALILLDVVDGTVEIDEHNYTVRLGYAIYSIQHDAMKVVALATDDDGNVFRLKLRGNAVDETDQFPMESGSIGLIFGGISGESNTTFEEWSLLLEGTVKAV
jgi:hypothetical protein